MIFRKKDIPEEADIHQNKIVDWKWKKVEVIHLSVNISRWRLNSVRSLIYASLPNKRISVPIKVINSSFVYVKTDVGAHSVKTHVFFFFYDISHKVPIFSIRKKLNSAVSLVVVIFANMWCAWQWRHLQYVWSVLQQCVKFWCCSCFCRRTVAISICSHDCFFFIFYMLQLLSKYVHFQRK